VERLREERGEKKEEEEVEVMLRYFIGKGQIYLHLKNSYLHYCLH
jgi:hypothetical protein